MKAVLLCALIAVVMGVEVNFENSDGGFFIKHTARWSGGGPPPDTATATSPVGALLSLDRFTVLKTAQPVSVRATYGPFSTKQTVPARYGVPDPFEAPALDIKNGTSSLIEIKEAKVTSPHRLDVSAHIVSRELSRDAPNLRVLFHAGSDASTRRVASGRSHRICISAHATFGTRTITASCSPDGEEGACLAELPIPADWWPSETKGKKPPRLVKLTYSAAESGNDVDVAVCGSKIAVQPAWSLGTLTLIPARAGWRESKSGNVALLTPRASLYPHSKFHIPFVLKKEFTSEVNHLEVKVRIKAGLKLISVTSTSAQWTIISDIKSRTATVTATRKLDVSEEGHYINGPWMEIFAFLVEVGSEAGRSSARLAWSVRHMTLKTNFGDVTKMPPDTSHPRITTRFDIEKDDIQAVLPISKNWEVLNTAVLTGRQVSQAMKVLIVSQAGKVADVTLQSSCHSEDESVLKVSSSCSSVYVDGSEIRGSSNASVIVKYSTYTGLAKFTVWMPEFPLEIDVADSRLSQIKGWKVVEDDTLPDVKTRARRTPFDTDLDSVESDFEPEVTDHSNSIVDESRHCKYRYQQSKVEVYAQFLAKDHDSGRVTYFVSRRTWLKVTELVSSLMRVSDPRVASLDGKILRGRSMGRTEVQVLSPITGRVIAAKEVRVVNDKVTLSKLMVRVISGLQLNISPDSHLENGYISETTITRKLTAQYQSKMDLIREDLKRNQNLAAASEIKREGLLDIDIEFSDGSRTPLRDVPITDYFLLVETLDPEVVAFAPMVASHHPRVIAVGEGNGELLRVSLFTPDSCRSGSVRKLTSVGKDEDGAKTLPGLLATSSAKVEVDFSSGDMGERQRPDALQNDDIASRRSDMADILMRFPLKDERRREPSVQARQHGKTSGINPHRHNNALHMSTLEMGMYVLLAAFCCAILIFVISCVVYAARLKPAGQESNVNTTSTARVQSPLCENGNGKQNGVNTNHMKRESTADTNDWVWLGRKTLERNGNKENTSPDNIRITGNPLNLNYIDPDDAIREDQLSMGHCDNGNEVPNTRRVIDTKTYCKRPSRLARNGFHENQDKERDIDEYRPPVPPHRVYHSPKPNHKPVLADTIMPPVRRSHSKNQNKRNDQPAMQSPTRNQEGKRVIQRQPNTGPLNRPDTINLVDRSQESECLVEKMAAARSDDCSGMFAFDADAPLVTDNDELKDVIDYRRTFTKPLSPDETSPLGFPEVQVRKKQRMTETKRECVASDDFVEPQHSDGSSGDVKRATIIGNPMYSTRRSDMDENIPRKGTEDQPDSLSLNELMMDYDQIMSYFHNLKESNA